MAKQKNPWIVAVDIGYGNLKYAWGFGNTGKYEHSGKVPGTAAPASNVSSLNLGRSDGQGLAVRINGNVWMTGCDLSMLETYNRETNNDFISSDQYYALFLHVLAKQNKEVVDVLATGLPVDDYKDPINHDKLRALMTGKHVVDLSGREVEVKSVEVYPQPAGAFFKYLSEDASDADMDIVRRDLVTICDPGFYTWDFVSFKKQSLHMNASGTQRLGMQKALEETAKSIKEEHATSTSAQDIEELIQKNEDTFLTVEGKHDLAPYIKKGSDKIAQQAVKVMQNKMDTANIGTPLIVIMAGGGGKFYSDSVRALWPKSKVVEIGVEGIVQGYWYQADASWAAQANVPTEEESVA